jgi:glycosyltransferase involved in cell wall biosynthesis
VISEGPGADHLIAQREIHQLDKLLIFKFQPFEQLPNVLGTADVLMAVLEPYAGAFSVPSKVLTYLCAQRPLLLAVPFDNLVSRYVLENDAGRVVDPTNSSQFIETANLLLKDNSLRIRLAQNGRKFAERSFNICEISDKFEAIFEKI